MTRSILSKRRSRRLRGKFGIIPNAKTIAAMEEARRGNLETVTLEELAAEIAIAHRRNAPRRRTFAVSELSPETIEATRLTKMDARHEPLNQLLCDENGLPK